MSNYSPSVDNKICSGVARKPENYLVPHPTDCTKFYSCQVLHLYMYLYMYLLHKIWLT